MDESQRPDNPSRTNIFFEGISTASNSQPNSTKRGIVREVCREWLIHEDGALAHQLQDQEIAAHYGHNREKNRMVRQDTPHARKEQEVELKQALALQKLEQELRAQQEKEDEEAARKLAEELEKEELRKAHCALQRDLHIAKSFQEMDLTESRAPHDINHKKRDDPVEKKSYKLSSATRTMDLNQPMSEEEARQWQELCDAEMAKKLQEEEEEESKFRRDVRDLSKKLAIEARDRELAQMLQEKEKARLRKAKEKARIKAQQKISNSAEDEQHKSSKVNHSDHVSQYPLPAENIALSIDPTWNLRQRHLDISLPQRSQNSIPITDLDFPATVQPIVGGHRRSIYTLSNSLSSSPMPESEKTDTKKSEKSTCSHQ